MNFPTLQSGSADFKEEVAYEVKAKHNNGKLIITHRLAGKSFIKRLILDGKARFSVALFYRASAQRKHSVFEEEAKLDKNKIIAKQEVPNEFSYAPEIRASIITIEDVEITLDEQSGLNSSFRQSRSKIDIPSYVRIALHPDIILNDSSISSIISIRLGKNFTKGEIEVRVDKSADTNQRPIEILCAKDIYDLLGGENFKTLRNIKDEKDAIRLAIVIQILCAAYGEVIKDRKEEITSGSLIKHLNELKEETDQNWEREDFNPSLAATKMLPYQFDVL